MTSEPDSGRHWLEATDHWMPLHSAIRGSQEHVIRGMVALRDGLSQTGVSTRLDDLVFAHHRLAVFSVRTPFDTLEETDRWLQEHAPEDEPWSPWAAVRWPDIHTRYAAFYPRDGARLLSKVPGVQVHGAAVGSSPEEWVTIDSADVAKSEELRSLDNALTCRGLETCRFDLPDGWSVLAVNGGTDPIDRLEIRVEAALRGIDSPIRSRYTPWTWNHKVIVHIHPDEYGWTLREWLERELGGVHVDASSPPELGLVTLDVPIPFFHRARELCRNHPPRARA